MGIDPGCFGALAILEGRQLVDVFDMPRLIVRRGKTDKAEVDGYALAGILSKLAIDVAYIELVGGIMGQAAGAAFNFGRAAAAPEYMLKALGVRVERIAPATWKRDLKLGRGKDAAVERASLLFPQASSRWAAVRGNGVAHQREGRAEAALIAEWGRMQLKEGETNVFG